MTPPDSGEREVCKHGGPDGDCAVCVAEREYRSTQVGETEFVEMPVQKEVQSRKEASRVLRWTDPYTAREFDPHTQTFSESYTEVTAQAGGYRAIIRNLHEDGVWFYFERQDILAAARPLILYGPFDFMDDAKEAAQEIINCYA